MFDDFYGLDGRPFQLTPDPAFYFESQTHRKALSYLGYSLAQGEGFVVITGEVGAGKSTLVAHLMAMIDPARLTAAQVVTSRLDGDEIVHVVAQAFGLLIDGHDKAGALGAIENFLHDEARAGRRCLLIVDESQHLSIEALEELRMLSNFQLGAHPLLQTLLLGQPEFRDTLLDHPSLEQLRQRVIATYHLQAMEPQEVQLYIEHRLACVGWAGNPSFDQRVFAEIYDTTGGIPRRINQIVNRLLLLGSVDQRTRIDGVMLQQVLAELDDDGAIALLRPAPPPKSEIAAPEAAEDEPHAAEELARPDIQVFVVEDETTADEAIHDEDVAEVEGGEHLAEAEADVSDEAGAEIEIQCFIADSDDSEAEEDADASEFAADAEAMDDGWDDEIDARAEDEGDEGDNSDVHASAERINFARPFDSQAASEIEDTLAEQGAQIAALRQAVYDLADAASDSRKAKPSAGTAEFAERLASIEGRLLEQDLTIRHTLTMLIEWIESGEGSREAA